MKIEVTATVGEIRYDKNGKMSAQCLDSYKTREGEWKVDNAFWATIEGEAIPVFQSLNCQGERKPLLQMKGVQKGVGKRLDDGTYGKGYFIIKEAKLYAKNTDNSQQTSYQYANPAAPQQAPVQQAAPQYQAPQAAPAPVAPAPQAASQYQQAPVQQMAPQPAPAPQYTAPAPVPAPAPVAPQQAPAQQMAPQPAPAPMGGFVDPTPAPAPQAAPAAPAGGFGSFNPQASAPAPQATPAPMGGFVDPAPAPQIAPAPQAAPAQGANPMKNPFKDINISTT